MSEFLPIFNANLERVDSLCNIYTKMKDDRFSDGKDYKLTDMLRAAIVMLHSAFEEYYRNVIKQWLPTKGDKKALETIALPDDVGNKGTTKYTLYSLMDFKDKTINDLFLTAINEYMSRQSFNSFDEICKWSCKIGLDLSNFKSLPKKYYDDIDKAVHRRHKIVHEADTSRNNEKQTDRLTPIMPGTVLQWKEAYQKLVQVIDAQIDLWSENNT